MSSQPTEAPPAQNRRVFPTVGLCDWPSATTDDLLDLAHPKLGLVRRDPVVLERWLQADFPDWDRKKDRKISMFAHLVRVTPMSSAKPPSGKFRFQTLSNRLDQSGSDAIHALRARDHANMVFFTVSLFCGAGLSKLARSSSMFTFTSCKPTGCLSSERRTQAAHVRTPTHLPNMATK